MKFRRSVVRLIAIAICCVAGAPVKDICSREENDHGRHWFEGFG